jgi:hypothetical protein
MKGTPSGVGVHALIAELSILDAISNHCDKMKRSVRMAVVVVVTA